MCVGFDLVNVDKETSVWRNNSERFRYFMAHKKDSILKLFVQIHNLKWQYVNLWKKVLLFLNLWTVCFKFFLNYTSSLAL